MFKIGRRHLTMLAGAGSVAVTGTAATLTYTPDTVQLADPTQLPVMTKPGQTRHASFTYGRSLTAGQTYVDPQSSCTVLKLTSSTVPAANSSAAHGYATSGPRISQPWTGGDGKTYYTLVLDAPSDWMVDVCLETMVASNWRATSFSTGEVDVCWSLNPATPRIIYYIDGKTLHRYNTATMALADTGNFPHTFAATGTTLRWIHSQLNDVWFAGMLTSNQTYVAWNANTNTEINCTQTRSGQTHDELHLDLLNPVVYMSTDQNASGNAPWRLDTNTIDVTPSNAAGMSDDHAAAGAGFICGTVPFDWPTAGGGEVGGGMYVYNGFTDVHTRPIVGYNNYSDGSEFYTNADCLPAWWPGDGVGWHIRTKEASDFATGKVRYRMLAAVKNNGSDMRLIGSHDSNSLSYPFFSKARFSPDGKMVLFTSDMNGSSRTDVFVLRMPVA